MNSSIKKRRCIKKFEVNLDDLFHLKLDKRDKKILGKLVEAAESICVIYEKQVNDKYLGGNFYPNDATKEEIEKAALKDPAILGPYTMVERKNGQLVAIPYHVKFKNELVKITKLLNEAASITANRELARRLRAQSEALLNGNYAASDIYWLSLKPYKIDIVIGPIERYDDKLFFTKCAYQAWVGVMDESETQEAVQLKETIYASHQRIFAPFHKVNFLDKIQVRVDNTLIFSGLITRYGFTSTNLPNDVNLMEKYGSEITVFKQSFDEKFKTLHHPIFHRVFEENFQISYQVDILKRGSLRNTVLHEISHPLMRYRDAESRLKELFPIFDEISASVYGVKACGALLLKNAISQKELEAIIVMFICKAFSWWFDYLKQPSTIHYTKGYAIALNYFLENGSLKETDGISWPNFTKLFVSFEELATILERILSVGSYKEAQQFVDRYGSLDVFQRFQSRLRGIKI